MHSGFEDLKEATMKSYAREGGTLNNTCTQILLKFVNPYVFGCSCSLNCRIHLKTVRHKMNITFTIKIITNGHYCTRCDTPCSLWIADVSEKPIFNPRGRRNSDWLRFGVQFPEWAHDFSLLQGVPTGSRTVPSLFPNGYRGLFLRE
jgi:hypothetical protein